MPAAPPAPPPRRVSDEFLDGRRTKLPTHGARVSDRSRPRRPHAARAASDDRSRRRCDRRGEARVHGPGRLGQGPHRDQADRGGRTSREAQARRDDRRADLGQHRRRARHRRRDQGLPLHLRDARQDEPGEDLAPARVRRRSRHLPVRRRARVAGELLLRVRPPRRGDSGRLQARPVHEPRQPGGALRVDGPGDLGADRRGAGRARDRGRHRRDDLRRGPLHQGAGPRRADRRRRPRRLDLHRRRQPAPVPRGGDRRGLLPGDLRPRHRRPVGHRVRQGLVPHGQADGARGGAADRRLRRHGRPRSDRGREAARPGQARRDADPGQRPRRTSRSSTTTTTCSSSASSSATSHRRRSPRS